LLNSIETHELPFRDNRRFPYDARFHFRTYPHNSSELMASRGDEKNDGELDAPYQTDRRRPVPVADATKSQVKWRFLGRFDQTDAHFL
jgi:hypothetical protein